MKESPPLPADPGLSTPPGAEGEIGTSFAHRVPIGQKLAFGAGGAAEDLMNNSANVMMNPVYNLSLGVSPALLGIAQAAPRFWDAVFGPFVGTLSDNARTRWGRRKPFMVAGAILAALSFSLLWWVPTSWGHTAMFIYATVVSLVFYSASTLFQVPWSAMGLGLTADTHERTRVMAVRQYFALPVGFGLPWLFWLITRDFFESPVHGARVVAFGISAAILLATLIPALCCRESYDQHIRAQKKFPLLEGFLISFRNPPFVILILLVVSILVGLFLVDTLGLYLMIFHVYGGDSPAAAAMQGWTGTAYKLSSLVFLPFVAVLSGRFGKRTVLGSAIVLAAVGTALKFACYTPANPWLTLIPAILMGPGLTAMFVLTSSLLADVCDYDEWMTSCRREAMYSAVFGWCVKVGLTAALMLSGFILVGTGFQQELGPIQPPGTLLWMRILFSTIPPAALLLALVLTIRFPLTQSTLREVQSSIAKKRAQTPNLNPDL